MTGISKKSKILLGIGILAAFIDSGFKILGSSINFFSPVAYILIMLVLIDNQTILLTVLKNQREGKIGK